MAKTNIDIKDLLPLLKKLNVLKLLKNNLALLVPIVIALVAILLFVPTTILSGRLRETIQKQSVGASQSIDRSVKEVDEAAAPEAIDPYIKAYAQDANAMDNLVIHTTERELLSYKLFPDMNETSPLLFEPFRQAFVAGVEAMLKNLNAGGPPSDTEILTALESSPSRSMFGRSRSLAGKASLSPGGGFPGRGLNFRMMSETDRKMVAKICEDRAKAAKVYAAPVDLGGYAYWSDWKFDTWEKAIKDTWYWQMAFWALEDVATTVQQMNRDSENVLRSPVKRIMNVLFTQSRTGRTMIGGRGRRAGAGPKDKQTPTYVTALKNAMTGTPCTGRFCNETYDVMQFEVRAVVNAAEVMRYMQELCSAKTHKFRGWRGDQPEQTYKHNQITILESNIIPVDREDYTHSSYEYGQDEVVDVDLVCEYIFDKAAYAKIQPKIVLDDMAASAAPAARR